MYAKANGINTHNGFINSCSARREMLRARVSKEEMLLFERASDAEGFLILGDWIRRVLTTRAQEVIQKEREHAQPARVDARP